MALIGYTIPQRGVFFEVVTYSSMIELARTADSSGVFDSIWVGDSLSAKPRPESLALLGGLATATTNCRLGIACMASFPLRDPILLSYQWATLDRMSEGRMQLAICTGIVKPQDASAHEGSPWGISDTERPNRMVENLQICRALWSNDAVTFDGDHWQFHDVTIDPKPVQDPCPVWIAANPRPGSKFERDALKRVAELADGWMTSRGAPQLASGFDILAEELGNLGKRIENFPVVSYHNINIGSTRQEALDESKRFLDLYYGPVFDETAVEHWTAAGTPEQCARDIMHLAEAGATHVTLRATSWDQEEQLQRLITEVFPLID